MYMPARGCPNTESFKKKIPRKPKSKRGILLTLLTLVIFILMLGEVITYVVLNINYDACVISVSCPAAAHGSALLYGIYPKRERETVLFYCRP